MQYIKICCLLCLFMVDSFSNIVLSKEAAQTTNSTSSVSEAMPISGTNNYINSNGQIMLGTNTVPVSGDDTPEVEAITQSVIND